MVCQHLKTQQGSKLLLALASTVLHGFGPRDQVCVWKWGLLFDERGCLVFLSMRHICCTVIQHESARTHTVYRGPLVSAGLCNRSSLNTFIHSGTADTQTVIFKNSVRTSQETHYVTVTNIIRLRMLR
jgi:hypothetical protein